MSRIISKLGPACAILAVSALFAPAQAEPICIADWSDAGPIVRREGLTTIERVGRLARDRAALEIVDTALCRNDGHFVYRLTVRSGQGVLRTLFVDARKPFERPFER